jgi:hypothetical protein
VRIREEIQEVLRPQLTATAVPTGGLHRIDAIVEKFTDMQTDLDRERKMMMRLWSKREEQLRGVLDSTAGLYGDLQGIAGRAMQDIESLDVLMIEAKGEAAE